jgi:long-chain acyl-CoA synthetase
MYKLDFTNVTELLFKNAQRYPRKTFIFFNKLKYNYIEATREAKRVAVALVANGVVKGDRVALLLNNSPEYIFAYFCFVSVGAIVVPLKTFLTAREIALNLNDCTASHIVTSEAFEGVINTTKTTIDSLKKIFTFGKTSFDSVDILETVSCDYEPETPELDSIVSLIYTSGTTGVPKGVMLTHKNLLANVLSYKLELRTRHNDRIVSLLPLFHSYAFMACILGPLESGCSIILLETVKDVAKKQYRYQVLFLRPSLIMGVPQLYSAMAKMKVSFLTRLFYPFRLHVSGGESLPVVTIEKFQKNFRMPVIEGYGLSEASPIVCFNPQNKPKPGSVGKPLYGIKISIKDENDNPLPKNSVGELCVQADSVMKGYWNRPEETAVTLKNGWLHTGDLAYIDDEDYVIIVDRIKDLITSKGMNVYPKEVEDIIYKFPGVLLVAVVSLPNKSNEEDVITAYLKVENEATFALEELKEFLKENLASFKIPRMYIVINEMPLTGSGKVAKRLLKNMALNGEIPGH